MRIYYLFKLRDISLNSKKVYLILEELFYLNKNKFNYGIKVFNDLCLPIDKTKFINRYIENESMIINNSHIIIKTDKNVSKFFKYLNGIDNHFFVCDFGSKDYFYLNEFIILNLNRY